MERSNRVNNMSNDKKSFKVFCDAINEIISVKALHTDDLEKYRQKVYELIKSSTSIDLLDYEIKLINDFVVDGSKLLTKCEQTIKEAYEDDFDQVYAGIIESIYMSVCQVYPNLQLENIVQSLNQETLKGFLNSFLEELYEKEPNKASKRKPRRSKRGRIPDDVPQDTGKSLKTLADINQLEAELRKEVIGQDEAIDSVIRYVKLMVAELASNISLMFIGPTGVGKTKLAKVLGDHYSGNFFKINCSEYAQPHEYAKLIGSPPGYVGSTEKSILQVKADKSNKWVLLFDEIEKASPKLFDFMLALMDDGKVMASNGQELDFSESIILMTSNEGIKDANIGESTLGFGKQTITYEGSKDAIRKSVKKKFSPEFIGRVDEMVQFNYLSKDDLLKVAKLEIKNLPVRKTKALLNYIIENGTSEQYGARFIAKFITREVKSLLADSILSGEEPKNGKLYDVKVKNNKLVI
jgi:ATP-dependent Clp protease ATP-binding subunit ClpA